MAPPQDDLLASALRQAIERHAAGDLARAEQGYRSVLVTHPNHAGALGGLGALLGHSGHAHLAAKYLSEACTLDPDNIAHQHNYGEALRQLGDLPRAEAALRRVIALDPLFIPAYESLIAILRVAQAQAVATGIAARAAALGRELANLANNQGNAYLERRDEQGAIACYRLAIAHHADYAVAWSNLGNVLRNVGLISEAESVCRRAIALDASLAPAWNNLGNALVEQLRLDEARGCYEQAIVKCPELVEARHNRDSGSLFNLLFLPDLSAAEIARRHWAWGASFPRSEGRGWKNTRNPDRRLRVAYLSADFREHAMRHFIEPLIANHDAREVEVLCYAQNPMTDAHTQRMVQYGHRWQWTHTLNDVSLAERIERDAIDILVDCAGHTQGNRLAALGSKPAPVMITWLGYLFTTGLPAMDYRMTDAWVDPPQLTESLHTETLLRIPGGMMAYQPHEGAPSVGELPCLSRDCVTFGSLNNLQKVNVRLVEKWAQILHHVPGSRLLLQSKLLADPVAIGRMLGMFEVFGVGPGRLDLRPATGNFLQTYNEIDVALDTLPYGGGVTTCDALWMGVPVITLPGDRPAGRLTASILHQIGQPEWIADSAETYVHKAADLATQPERLREIRSGLRACVQNSTLCDQAGYVKRVESAYRTVWRHWLHGAAN
jgi:predicted O-linked N-acetylglucosamine transferase (SPINDLY family)